MARMVQCVKLGREAEGLDSYARHFNIGQGCFSRKRAKRERQRDTNGYTLELHCSSPCK